MNIALLNPDCKHCFSGEAENIAMHIGTRIKKLMTAQGVTGKDMAAYCEVTPGAVSGWFATGRISKETLAMVANRLGVSTDVCQGTGLSFYWAA